MGIFRRKTTTVAAQAMSVAVPAKTLPSGRTVAAVGESFYQGGFTRVCGQRTRSGVELQVIAELRPEPDNKFDKHAVGVWVNGHKCGHLSRDDARYYRAMVDEAVSRWRIATCGAQIRGGWDRGPNDEGLFGIWLDLAVPD